MQAKAEELLHIALENSRKKNDGLHELARLTDLEYLYKNLNDRKICLIYFNRKKNAAKRLLLNMNKM